MTGTEVCKLIMDEVNSVIIGKEKVVKSVLASIMGNGHILIEDIPGVGKTTLALAFSKVMGFSYKRMQFTPDVMPSDVTGFSIYNKETGEFEYKEGVIMCNLFLGDEINRTSSKTQSALLEAMEEGNVTVDGITRNIERPFIVIGTQNPIGSIGTSLLPESQLDRFMIKVSLGYPSKENEIEMLKSKENISALDNIKQIITKDDVVKMQHEVVKVYVHDDIYRYIIEIVHETRTNPHIMLGVSPRGTIALVNCVKAIAYINGRDYVVPDDVIEVVKEVFGHRILLNEKSGREGITVEELLWTFVKNKKIEMERA